MRCVTLSGMTAHRATQTPDGRRPRGDAPFTGERDIERCLAQTLASGANFLTKQRPSDKFLPVAQTGQSVHVKISNAMCQWLHAETKPRSARRSCSPATGLLPAVLTRGEFMPRPLGATNEDALGARDFLERLPGSILLKI